MKRIKDVKKDLIKLGVVTAVGAVTVGGVYYSGYKAANETHDENIFKSNVSQDITESYLKGTKVDAMIDSINTKLQLGLVEQNGVGSLHLQKYDKEWNKWLTAAEVEVSVEYEAMVGIEIADLVLVNTGDGLLVQYSLDDIKVLSIEVVNENIISNRNLFAQGYSDDDKSAIKKHIQEDTKQQIVNNEKVIKQANKELKDYLHTLADSFGVDITIIDAK